MTSVNLANPPTLADMLGAAAKIAPSEGRRWAAGPVCLRNEFKTYSPDLTSYTAWVAEVEGRIADTAETVQRLRLLHYGRAAGNVLFDLVLNTARDRLATPMTLAQGSQASLDGLSGAGTLTTFVTDSAGAWRHPVDVSHVWVVADAVLNGFGAGGVALGTATDPYGALSWTADLASWWSSYNDARLTARTAAHEAGQDWQEPTDAASLATPQGWLDVATVRRCAADDLLGDLDAIVLLDELRALPAGPTPLTTLLRGYYGPSPVQVGRALLHSDNRFHLFVRRALPAIPHTVDESTGVVTLDPAVAGPEIREHIRETTMCLLRIARLKRAGLGLGATALVSPAAGLIDALRIEKSVRDDVDSPWGAAMMDTVAARFTAFLVNGLATGGWDAVGWPQHPSPLAPYGGFLLRVGDSDAQRRYGGQAGAVATAQTYVRTLQQSLVHLGFTSVGEPDGEFGAATAMALRELQIEAQQPQVWQERPAPTGGYLVMPAARRFRGHVNGCLDPETATTVAQWMNPAGGLRNSCPVRVDARHVVGTAPGAVVNADVWRYNEVTDTTLRFYATDALERYAIPPARVLPGGPGMTEVGAFSTAETTGPVLGTRSSWPEAQIIVQTLVPPALIPPPPVDPGTLPVGSTYRVVRAIAAVECLGRFDIINAYDRGRVSIGVCHWALMNTGIGELAALLAYYAHVDPRAYERDFGRFGIAPEKPWDPATWIADGAGSQAKYAGRLALYGLRDQGGRVHPAEPLPLGNANPAQFADEYLIDYLRGWHALHRLAMALRTNDSMRHLMWQFTLFRLRMLLARPFHNRTAADPGPVVANPAGGHRVATFGEVFTSERAVVALLRWHVNRPGRVISAVGAVNDALAAFQAVHGTGRVDLSGLSVAAANAAAAALTQQLIDLAPTASGFRDSVSNAVTYVDAQLGALRTAAGSFHLV